MCVQRGQSNLVNVDLTSFILTSGLVTLQVGIEMKLQETFAFQKHVKGRTKQMQNKLRGGSPGEDTQLLGESQVLHCSALALHHYRGSSD